MIRTFRLRFFLTVWPLVVAALIAVGLVFGRWTDVELRRVEQRRPGGAPALDRALLDRLAVDWTRISAGEMDPLLRSAAARMPAGTILLLVDTAGAFISSSDPRLGRDEVRPDGRDGIQVVRRSAGGRVLEEVAIRGGTAILKEGQPVGRLYLLPGDGSVPPPQPAAAGLVRGARRTLWTAILLAGVVSALATLLIARPVVAQLRDLTHAASRIRAGALDTRVRVASADELGQLERSFNEMAEALESAEAAKRRIITDAAHELRTPLTNILGQLEGMRDGLRAPDSETLESTHEEARLLHGLVEDLLDLNLAQSGVLHFHLEQLDAREEVRRAASAFAGANGGVQLQPPPDGDPVWVRADRVRLAQVLRNLLGNALRHTPESGTVRLEVTSEGERATIHVTDTGPGIPEDQLPLIWERFHRVDESRDRASGGAGLGLAVVRELVHAMDGRADVHAPPGGGTTFRIHLPAATSPRL